MIQDCFGLEQDRKIATTYRSTAYCTAPLPFREIEYFDRGDRMSTPLLDAVLSRALADLSYQPGIYSKAGLLCWYSSPLLRLVLFYL